MSYTLFSATGCARCKIVMGRMDEMGLSYEEKNFKEEGKEEFQKFYTANRKAIVRGEHGVEFPVLTDDEHIRQGLGAVLGWLEAGEKMNGFFQVGNMRKEWLNGIWVSGGDPAEGEKFLQVLRYLKKAAMKLVVETNGANPDLLAKVVAEKLADRLIVHVNGPLAIHSRVTGQAVSEEDMKRTLATAAGQEGYEIWTTVTPVKREDGKASYLTPEEVGQAAALVEEATGSKKTKYIIGLDKTIRVKDSGLEPLTRNQLLPYRNAARRFQVLCELEAEE